MILVKFLLINLKFHLVETKYFFKMRKDNATMLKIK